MWAPDSKSVFYTARVGSNVELFRVPLDGKWLVYGSKRDGVRQLYVMRLGDRKEHRITDLKKGHAAMWASWQPAGKVP